MALTNKVRVLIAELNDRRKKLVAEKAFARGAKDTSREFILEHKIAMLNEIMQLINNTLPLM